MSQTVSHLSLKERGAVLFKVLLLQLASVKETLPKEKQSNGGGSYKIGF